MLCQNITLFWSCGPDCLLGHLCCNVHLVNRLEILTNEITIFGRWFVMGKTTISIKTDNTLCDGV